MINEVLDIIRDKIEEHLTEPSDVGTGYTIPVYKERAGDTDDESSICVWIDDSRPWSGDKKEFTIGLIVLCRYELSLYDGTFTESDAQDHSFDVWKYLLTHIPGMESLSVTCGYDDQETKRFYLVEMRFDQHR